jgi:hypothetical protein
MSLVRLAAGLPSARQEAGGGHYAWVWVIAIPRWVLCGLAVLGVMLAVFSGDNE